MKAAEELFVKRGYEAVIIKDIAKAAGIHHASIYHHVPGGKSSLYVEVMTNHMQRYRAGMQSAIDTADGNLKAQLQAIAAWIISQPPVDTIRLMNSDLPAIEDTEASEISDFAFEATLVPLLQVLEAAQTRGEIRCENPGYIAGAIFSSLESIHAIPEQYLDQSRQAIANQIIEVFVRGIEV